MKERATRLWGWVRSHRFWSSVMLIALLVGLGFGTVWTVNLVRFGPSPPTGQNCGSLQHGPYFFTWDENGTARADVSLQSLACFWQAYQICRAATISQAVAGTDAGHTDTLTIERRGNDCALYGHEDYFVNFDRGSETYLCTRLSKEGDSLQVSACDGIDPFTLDPRNPSYESYNCGIIGDPLAVTTPQQMEDCFFAAYQHCLADSFAYTAAINGVQMEREFYIDNHCGIAFHQVYAGQHPFDVKLATCASLEMHADGLHFSQCGTDGNIFVPFDTSS